MGKRTLALLALAYLITLLVTAPASLLGKCIQYVSQDRLLLVNASGTVWDGAATPALRTQDGRLVALPFLRWKTVLSSLPAGKLRITLQWDEQVPSAAMEAILTLKQVELHHVQIQLPARILEEVSAMLKPAQFRGQLLLRGDRLAFSNSGMEGTMAVDWYQASSALSSIAPLGDYHLMLNGAGKRITIGLTTSSGILQLEGEGSWLMGSGLEFHGTAQAAPEKYDKLAELLHHLGPEVSPGIHGFNLAPQ